MFNCGICGKTTNPHTKQQMLVVIAQRLTKGWKTIREERACPPCVGRYSGPKWL